MGVNCLIRYLTSLESAPLAAGTEWLSIGVTWFNQAKSEFPGDR
jgi:hypothetical protein